MYACQRAEDGTRRRALPALLRVAGRMVCLRPAILVSVLFLLLWYTTLAGLGTRPTIAADAIKPPWRVGEIIPERSWYWGEVPRKPVVQGGYVTCVTITGGQRCVLVTQGLYRYLIADGVILEDRRYRLRLLQVWR